MATKTKGKGKPESTRAAKKRRLAILDRAWADGIASGESGPITEEYAAESYSHLHAIVRAVLPGKQSDANTAVALDLAAKAIARVIRRNRAAQ